MRGMLMFAHDNGLFDYGKMAYASSLAAVHHIDEPVSLVTDILTWRRLTENYPRAESLFEQLFFVEPDTPNERQFDLADGTTTKAEYHNTTRLKAYELSPYDETLLIDTDVLIQDSSLTKVWGSKSAVRMNCEVSEMVKEMYGGNTIVKLEEKSMPIFWATICYFRQCPMASKLFEWAQYVVENYSYYGVLYGFPTAIIRVDFALTVAAHIMSGCVHKARTVVEPLPNETTTFAWNKDIMIDVEKGRTTFLTQFNGQGFPVSTYRTVHCLNKDSLLNMADRIIECYA
jgi:hypothetical protein